MTARAVVVSLVLLVGALGVQVASRNERIPARDPLSGLPTEVAQWQGEPTERFDQQILAVLGADDYLNRVYVDPAYGSVGFFIAYYQSQRTGSKLHSPEVCLPGSGWQTQQERLLAIPVTASSGDRTIEVNRVIIVKGLERQVVLYWYQSQGRVVANDVLGKDLFDGGCGHAPPDRCRARAGGQPRSWQRRASRGPRGAGRGQVHAGGVSAARKVPARLTLTRQIGRGFSPAYAFTSRPFAPFGQLHRVPGVHDQPHVRVERRVPELLVARGQHEGVVAGKASPRVHATDDISSLCFRPWRAFGK